jgi:hypothetical protein
MPDAPLRRCLNARASQATLATDADILADELVSLCQNAQQGALIPLAGTGVNPDPAAAAGGLCASEPPPGRRGK